MAVTHHVVVRRTADSHVRKHDCDSKSAAYTLARKKRKTLDATGFVQVFEGPKASASSSNMVAFLTKDAALFDIIGGRARKTER
jgi:hypothetical protein